MLSDRNLTLLCPGPVNVDTRIRDAMIGAEIGHREPEFSVLVRRISSLATRIAGLDPAKALALTITGSGTAANEAVLSSAIAEHERVLVLTNGEFGQRLDELSRIHNPNTQIVRHAWGQPLDLPRIRACMQAQGTDWVVMVHHETSTGHVNPVAEVGALCRELGARLIVDAVSSFSAEPIDMKRCGITLMTTASGKALGAYPGVSLVIGSHAAFKALPSRSVHCQYLSLQRHYEFSISRGQTPNTPAVPLLLAVEKGLEIALEDTVAARHARLARLAEISRKRLHAMGFELLLDRDYSVVATSALLPPWVEFESMRRALHEHGYVIYGGKGPFDGRLIQVATLGTTDQAVLDRFFVVLETIVRAMLPSSANA